MTGCKNARSGKLRSDEEEYIKVRFLFQVDIVTGKAENFLEIFFKLIL